MNYKSLKTKVVEYIKVRFVLLRASTIYTFLNETAYWADNWSGLFSTFFYNVAYLLFIKVIYANTTTIAGYSYNEMMFFYFIVEVTVYISYVAGWKNIRELIADINKGDLDLVLTKPIPSLFYVTYKKIRVFTSIRDGVPPLILIALLINWSQFSFNFLNIICAVLIMILGMTCIMIILLISAIPTFWIGEGDGILGLFNETQADSSSTVPFEGYSNPLKIFFTLVFPTLFMAAVSTSVLFGKSDPFLMLLYAFVVTILMLRVRSILWNWGLRNYTSASS